MINQDTPQLLLCASVCAWDFIGCKSLRSFGDECNCLATTTATATKKICLQTQIVVWYFCRLGYFCLRPDFLGTVIQCSRFRHATRHIVVEARMVKLSGNNGQNLAIRKRINSQRKNTYWNSIARCSKIFMWEKKTHGLKSWQDGDKDDHKRS